MTGPRTTAYLQATRDNALASVEALLEELEPVEESKLRIHAMQSVTLRLTIEDHLRSAEAAARRLEALGKA